MQVHTEQRTVLRGNLQNETQFTIKNSAKAFNILSSNLYSDKPLAIVRELCCNAYDSHVEAGKKDVPIEVILPSRINPTLTIRDFGIGLDHDGIVNIYSKFFESTKTESNDFVGQLGLGSKAPFSMFKTFTVEARKNGVQRVYAVYTNEDGIPTLSQMSETPTLECNGVAVSMSCKPDDFDKFSSAAKRALMYFNPKPIVNGAGNFSTHTVKHGVGGSNWKVRESEYWARMSGPYVVQGFVVYPIDSALIRETGDMSASARVVSELNLDFWMDIGSVDVAPSREALSYDKRTVANLAAAFETVANEMRVVIQADFDTAKTAHEAGVKLHKYEQTGDYAMRRLFESMHATQAFTWNGKEITYKHALDVTQIKSTVVARAQSTGRKLQYSSRHEPTTLDVKRLVTLIDNTAVLIDDIFSGGSDIVKQFLDNSPASSVVVLKATKKAEYNEAEIKSILKMLGDAPAKKLSELPYKRTPKAKAAGRSKEDRLRFCGFPKDRWSSKTALRRVFSRLTWDTVQVDLNKGGFYIPLDRFSAIHKGRVQDHLDDILTGAVELGLMTQQVADNDVFGFNEKEVASAPANWVNLFDHLDTQFQALNLIGKIVEANAVKLLNSKMESFNRYMGANWDNLASKVVDGKFKKFITKVRALNNTNDIDSLDAVNRFVTVFGSSSVEDINNLTRIRAFALQGQWSAVLDAHGLLRLIDWYHLSDVDAQNMVVDYINLVAMQ